MGVSAIKNTSSKQKICSKIPTKRMFTIHFLTAICQARIYSLFFQKIQRSALFSCKLITFNSNRPIYSPGETVADIVLDIFKYSHGNAYSEVLSKVVAYQHGVR